MRPNIAGQTKNRGQFISRMPPGAIAQFKWGWDVLLRFGDFFLTFRLTEAQQRAILWIKKFEAPSKNPERLLSVLPA
jgi:hypothetical protein